MAVSISLETDARLKWQMQEQLTTRLPEWFGQPESNRQYAAQADLLPGYNAAYNKAIPFADPDGPSHEEWTKILDINLTGPMLLTKAAAPALKRQGERADRQHLFGRQGGPDPSHQVHGGGAGARGAGELRRARPARGHARGG